MAWLEFSALGVAMRETGVWTYALVNLGHIFGISLLFGSVVMLDLRLLGFWRWIPLDQMARPTTAVAGVGFAVAVLTGPAMLATKATEYVGNPFLPIKLVAIAIGIINIAIVHNLSAWKQRANPQLGTSQRRQLAMAGATSLFCWVSAITAARLIAYF